MAGEDTEPTTDAKGKRAQHRLSGMHTTAVGLVDHAANEETFLIVKSKGGASMTTETTKADGAEGGTDNEGGLRLPAAAKQSLTDGLAESLEKLAAIAQQLDGAVVDESAECPPELASQIDEIADDLDDLADEFAPKASPADMKAKSETNKAKRLAKKGKAFPGAAPPFGSKGKDEAEKAKAFPGAAPPFGSKGKDEAAEDVAKDAPPGAPPEVKKDPPNEGPGGAEAPVQPRNTTTNPDVVMKSGRKMAQERLAMLAKGHQLHAQAASMHDQAAAMHGQAAEVAKSAHGCIGQVMKDVGGDPTGGQVAKEVGDPAFMQPPGAAPKSPPDSAKPPPDEPEVSPKGGMPDVSGMAKAAIAEALAAPMSQISEALAEMKAVQKSVADSSALQTLRDLTGKPRSVPSETPPTVAPTKKMSWGNDISADIKADKRAAAAAAKK